MRITLQELQEIRELPNRREVELLRELDLSNKHVSEIGHLSKLVELENLNLSFNELTSIAELSSAARLTRLLVPHNKLSLLDGVDHMRQLRVLEAHRNRISDLSPLRACVELEELWVHTNPLRDIHMVVRCLSELPKLRRVVLFPNQFCKHTEGKQYDLCRAYLLTKLRSLTHLDTEVREHEREEADEFFRTEQGMRELKALVPADSAKESRNRARPPAVGPPDVNDETAESAVERRRGHWHRSGSGHGERGSPTASSPVAIAALVSRKGAGRSHLHQPLPKDELLQWLNGMLGLSETLDTLVSTAAICQVMDVVGRCCTATANDGPVFPDCVPMHKVNFCAIREHECVKNYKVLQEVFRRFGIREQPNWSTLALGRSTDLLQLLRWSHSFCEQNGITASEWAPIDRGDGSKHGRWYHEYMLKQHDGTEYNPVRRREKAVKPPTQKKPSPKFTAHVARRSGAFSQTERAVGDLHQYGDESDSPRQTSPVWGETRAETQARAYSSIKSNATSPRVRSRTAGRAQRASHSSPSRVLRSPSTGAGRARTKKQMQTQHRASAGKSPIATNSEVDGDQWQRAQRKLRKIQQLCDNARGSSPGRENRDLDEFISRIERVLASDDTQGPFVDQSDHVGHAKEAASVSSTSRADRDEIALLRAQIEAIDAKISQRDTMSPAASVTTLSNAPPAPFSSGRATRRVQSSVGLHVPSRSQLAHAFKSHQGDDTQGILSWDGAQRASEDLFPDLAADTVFFPLLLRHAFEAADLRQSESLDLDGLTTFADAVVYFHRSWDRFQFVQDELLGGGKRRSLDIDQFIDACDHVFEGQPCPPAPDPSSLTDDFQKLTQGLGGVSFGDFTSWAARTMCEPIDDEFDSAEDQEDYDEDREDESYEVATDADEWRRGKSRQYGGGEVVGRAVEDQPPPLSFVNQEPAGTKDDALHSAAVSWEYRRDEDTGMSYKVNPKTGETEFASSEED